MFSLQHLRQHLCLDSWVHAAKVPSLHAYIISSEQFPVPDACALFRLCLAVFLRPPSSWKYHFLPVVITLSARMCRQNSCEQCQKRSKRGEQDSILSTAPIQSNTGNEGGDHTSLLAPIMLQPT